MVAQAKRQLDAVKGTRYQDFKIQWHVNNEYSAGKMRELFEKEKIAVEVVYTPPNKDAATEVKE